MAIQHDAGKQTPNPQHLDALGILIFRNIGFFDKNLYSSQMKSERALSCSTLFNGYFTPFGLIEDIGKFYIIYQNPFPKDAKNDILFWLFRAVRFWWGFFWFFLVGEGGEESHVYPDICKISKTPTAKSGLPLRAAPAAIPSGPYTTHLHVYLEPNQRLMVMGKH